MNKGPKSTSAQEAPTYSVSSSNVSSRRSNRTDSTNDYINLQIPKLRPPSFSRPSLNGNNKRLATIVVAVMISVATGFAGGYWGATLHDNNTSSSSLSSQKKIVTSEGELISTIAKTVSPSVVSVDVIGQTESAGLYSNLFGVDNGGGQQESAGTGIILSSDGLIITNRHVVPAGTTSVSVTLSDGTQLKNVQVLGRTSDSDSLDVAFLKITNAKGHKLIPAVIGDSSKVALGDAVVAIGNALGQFQNTVTSGIISGFGRSVQAGDSSGQQASENLDDLFQTDAAINEGNSGGPLVNLNGQVIGINTAIASNSQNIGFAIPINDVAGLIKQVQATGKFQRPYIGVRYVPLTPDVASYYGLNVDQGVFIVPSSDADSPSVIPGSPAEQAGLKEGDVITQVDNTKIDQNHSLTSIIGRHTVGDKLRLTVLRDGKTLHLNVTLAAAPSN